ncbi:MAG TPA: rhodanese-like domain-containing protein [Actinomycetota bacterium]|jgi:rhodanese-related sulfurtransferase|nr:rhodanese-like domain-containing protein [Actinomycetota bacterium]
MPRPIGRTELRQLQADGAHVVEVLPSAEYEEQHLPGAVHIPLQRIDEARERLEPGRPIIVYCWDST